MTVSIQHNSVRFAIETIPRTDALAKAYPITFELDDGDADKIVLQMSTHEARAMLDAFAKAIDEVESD